MTVSADFKTFLGLPAYTSDIKGETLALIAPVPTATMKIATREKCWGVGGQKGRRPVRIT